MLRQNPGSTSQFDLAELLEHEHVGPHIQLTRISREALEEWTAALRSGNVQT